MATTYKTFTRSMTSLSGFGKSRKRTVSTGLTYDQAYDACEKYNNNRTAAQKRNGTKLEFTAE